MQSDQQNSNQSWVCIYYRSRTISCLRLLYLDITGDRHLAGPKIIARVILRDRSANSNTLSSWNGEMTAFTLSKLP
jgi:hypothetical protein